MDFIKNYLLTYINTSVVYYMLLHHALSLFLSLLDANVFTVFKSITINNNANRYYYYYHYNSIIFVLL